jgi:NADPH:quinone reductase-like Zn-dependent oxidoreductase
MKAAICTRYGSPDVIEVKDIPKPTPKNHQILVRIICSAVNSGDVRLRSLDVKGPLKFLMRLVLGWSKPRNPVLGTVFSGIVESIGNKVTKFKAGDKVFGMTGFNFGTHAEYITVKEKSHVLPMPHNASFEDAASIIFGGQAALYYLDKAIKSQTANAKILILGATGSVGTSAVQIVKYYNFQITALCSSQGEKLMKNLGIENIIYYDKCNFSTHTEKYDVIFDAVGKYTKKQCKHIMNRTGVFISVGVGYASEKLHQLQQMKELFEKGHLQAVIDKTFCLNEIIQAHHYVDTGRKKGNVVVKLN